MARVIFLQRIWYEYGAPEILSAVLKQNGHQTDMVIGETPRDALTVIQDNNIVAFSTMSGDHRWACSMAQAIKEQKNVLTVLGGPHPTYFPETIEHPAIDLICRGEGEGTLVDIANAHDARGDFSSIPNLVLQQDGTIIKNEVRPLIADLKSLPLPDREIYYQRYPLLKKSYVKPFMASRGCPFSCNFCFNDQLRALYHNKGPYVRFRSAEHIINEIHEVTGRYGLRSIYFADDLFAYDQTWVEDFCRKYKQQVNKPFFCSATINTLNENIIRALKEAGCEGVSFGIETGNEHMRQELLNKRISNARIEETASLFHKHRLKFMTFNILGLPGETLDNAFETIDLNIKIKTPYARCSLLTPYPGTRIAEQYKNTLCVDDIQQNAQQEALSFDVPQPRELYNLHYFFQTAVHIPCTIGIIKKLIQLPPNIFFKLWWGLVYFVIFTKAELRDPWHTFLFALKTARGIFTKRQGEHS